MVIQCRFADRIFGCSGVSTFHVQRTVHVETELGKIKALLKKRHFLIFKEASISDSSSSRENLSDFVSRRKPVSSNNTGHASKFSDFEIFSSE